jgi:hypothetical protein
VNFQQRKCWIQFERSNKLIMKKHLWFEWKWKRIVGSMFFRGRKVTRLVSKSSLRERNSDFPETLESRKLQMVRGPWIFPISVSTNESFLLEVGNDTFSVVLTTTSNAW